MVHIGNEWDQLLADEFKKDYYQKLRRFLAYDMRISVSIQTCMTSSTH